MSFICLLPSYHDPPRATEQDFIPFSNTSDERERKTVSKEGILNSASSQETTLMRYVCVSRNRGDYLRAVQFSRTQLVWDKSSRD